MSGGKLFRGGIPISPDVQRLEKEIPDSSLEPNRVIEYEEIEKILKISRHKEAGRFTSVVNRWRKYLLSKGVVLENLRNVGYQVCDDRGKFKQGKKKTKEATRRIKTAVLIYQTIDDNKLSEIEVRELTHEQRKAMQLLDIGRLRSKAALPSMTMPEKEEKDD